MSELHEPDTVLTKCIEEQELRLHRLRESMQRAPANEKPIIEDQVRKVQQEIRRMQAELHDI